MELVSYRRVGTKPFPAFLVDASEDGEAGQGCWESVTHVCLSASERFMSYSVPSFALEWWQGSSKEHWAISEIPVLVLNQTLDNHLIWD